MDFSSLMARFESIGDNCEFGFVQRAHGHEAGSLLRWGLLTSIEALIEGLQNHFAGIYEFDNLEPAGGGTMVMDAASRIAFHTQLHSTLQGEAYVFDATEAERRDIHAQEAQKVAYLVQKFFRSLEEGKSILIFKHNPLEAIEPALELHQTLRNLTACPMLLVTAGKSGETVGAVRKLAPGLYHGIIDRFAPYDHADDLSLDLWTQLCATTAAMVDQDAAAAVTE